MKQTKPNQTNHNKLKQNKKPHPNNNKKLRPDAQTNWDSNTYFIF